LDDWLSSEQRAISLAFKRLLEENLYWAVVHTRWIDPQGWEKTRPAFFGSLPGPLKWIVPPVARKGIRKEMHGHGMGRHSTKEIEAIGKRDISALADFLGNKPFFMGEQVSTLDATTYAFLANLLWAPFDTELKKHALQYRQLSAYCERMRSTYWQD
jgi:hypothetical protein